MPTYTNLSILQGWFEVEYIRMVTSERKPVTVIQGWIYTTDRDGVETCFDERHPVVISGSPAEVILDMTRKLNDKYPGMTGISIVDLSGYLIDQSQILVSQGRPYVIAQGKLLRYDGQSCVDIKHISFLGLPWGALDTLYELAPFMNRDVQALVGRLTPLEKYQMSQSIGMAMQALISLRTTS